MTSTNAAEARLDHRARDDCAVPDFFPLGDTHMLLFMSHQTGAQYYLGGWRDETFHPEVHGHMNWLPPADN